MVKEERFANAPRRKQGQGASRLCFEQSKIAPREGRTPDLKFIKRFHASIVVDCCLNSNCCINNNQ